MRTRVATREKTLKTRSAARRRSNLRLPEGKFIPQTRKEVAAISFRPRRYQKVAIKFLLQRNCAGLFLSPGLGKTSTTLATFLILKKEGLVKRMLVVAPRRPAHRVWPQERDKWIEFNGISMNVLHGPDKEELYKERADVDVVTLEGLTWLMNKARKEKVWPWDIIVFDESSKFKNTKTVRFGAVKKYLQKFRRRIILTGSPASNGLINLFGQIYILDLGNALGAYVSHYRWSFFNQGGYMDKQFTIKEGAEKIIYKRVKPLVLRMAAEDHLELPKLFIPPPIEIELPPKARKIYDDMEEEFLALLEDGKITAFNAGTASGKCRQIANGGVYDANHKVHHIHDEKTEALENLIDELEGKPLMVAYEYGHDLERLRKLLGKNVPYIGGGLSDKKQAWVEDAWNAGDIQVLPVQPASAAHGLNLQGTEAALCFYSLLYDLEHYEQLIRRLWRQGQKHAVFVYRLMARNTVDVAQIAALARKARTQNDLLKALRSYVSLKRAA